MPALSVPCGCCLDRMCKWRGGKKSPSCVETATGSNKCVQCNRNNKPCLRPQGVCMTHGLALKKLIEEHPGEWTKEIKEAQRLLRWALRFKKNREAAVEAEKQARLEREGRTVLTQERLVEVLLRSVTAQEQLVAKASEQIQKTAENSAILQDIFKVLKNRKVVTVSLTD
ncbi:hypothetical protein GGR54DRAFT_545813 [Hypoxylon sp. NC1633]|nr:hypothetical protein GGR54DRAFT_545813 [Hypoxylon sp. NC1633]